MTKRKAPFNSSRFSDMLDEGFYRDQAKRKNARKRAPGWRSVASQKRQENPCERLAAANDRKRELEEQFETARTTAERRPEVGGSVKAPTTDEGIPAFLDRRPLGHQDQLALDAIMMAWAKSAELRAALVGVSPVVRERFVAKIREDISAIPAGE
jgi:hypothetical protein